MPLSLNTRGVGKVTVVQCSGRIVAGNETEALRVHVSAMFRDRKNFILHLREVNFIDSSGLGTMVRLLTSTRQLHGDLKLCDIPESIGKVLKTTNLTRLFDTHETEESAISAFYHRANPADKADSPGRPVVCIDQNTDVLAYLRELLRRSGYDVHTSNSLHDSLILIRVMRPELLLLGPNMSSSPATRQAFDLACAKLPLVELGNEFSTLEAGEAAAVLLEKIRIRLNPQSEQAS
jgi:anti-sigma B factor antagonist